MLTLPQLQTVFKNLGKIIYAGQLSVANASGYRVHMLNLNRQFADSADYDLVSFNLLQQYDVSFQQQMNQLIAQENTGPQLVGTACDSYLTQLGPSIGGTSTSTPTGLANLLNTNMGSASGYVTPSGASDQYHSFATYFQARYGVTLPQSGSPNILDAWITTTIV